MTQPTQDNAERLPVGPYVARFLLNIALCATLSIVLVIALIASVGDFLYGASHFSGYGGALAYMFLLGASLVWGGLAGILGAVPRRLGWLRSLGRGAAITGIGIGGVTAIVVALDIRNVPWPPRIDGRRLDLEFEFVLPRSHVDPPDLLSKVNRAFERKYKHAGSDAQILAGPHCEVILLSMKGVRYTRAAKAVVQWPPERMDDERVTLRGRVAIGPGDTRTLELACRPYWGSRGCWLPLRDPERSDMEWTGSTDPAPNTRRRPNCDFPLRYRVRFATDH